MNREIDKHILVVKGREYSFVLSCSAVVLMGLKSGFFGPRDGSPGYEPTR